MMTEPDESMPRAAHAAYDPGQDFVEQSFLSYVVPARTDMDLDRIFKEGEASKVILGSIQQRDLLFFDETVEVLLILKMPWLQEEALQAQIKRLVLSLEVQIANSNSSSDHRDSQPAAEIIFTGHVEDVADPIIVVDEQEEEGDRSEDASSSQNVYAVWKMPVFLSRPRMRLAHPNVLFSASASLKPQVMGELSARGTGYLQSGVPSSFNLLESFSSDPALLGVKPRLSALRVSRVAPVSRQQDLVAHLRALPQLRIPIFPVIHTRVRISRPQQTMPSKNSLIALLEVDFTPHIECEVLLDKIELTTNEGNVESLSDGDNQMQLPMSCVSHDHITFLYHIKPAAAAVDSASQSLTGYLDISIVATAQVMPGICTPQLCMGWSTAIDFTAPVNASFNNISETTSIQRPRKPTQLSIGGSQAATTPPKLPSVLRPDSLPGLESSTSRTDAAISELGITMSFTGPSESVHPGDVFSWTVYVVNRSTSDKTARPPRKLALVAVPKRRRTDTRSTRPPSTASRRRGEKELADAVVDLSVLHALQKNSASDATDVICLSADVRVGPLTPGACHVAELQFLALREGIVGVEAVRVVDLTSQEHVDIRDLPTTIVEPPAAQFT